MINTKDKVADAAASARPYVERALRDQELRDNLRSAYISARSVYDELSSRRRMSDAASQLAQAARQLRDVVGVLAVQDALAGQPDVAVVVEQRRVAERRREQAGGDEDERGQRQQTQRDQTSPPAEGSGSECDRNQRQQRHDARDRAESPAAAVVLSRSRLPHRVVSRLAHDPTVVT